MKPPTRIYSIFDNYKNWNSYFWLNWIACFCNINKINLEFTSHICSSVGLSMSGTVRVESELVAFRPLLADGFHTRAPYCFNLSEITDRCSCNNMLSVFGICSVCSIYQSDQLLIIDRGPLLASVWFFGRRKSYLELQRYISLISAESVFETWV